MTHLKKTIIIRKLRFLCENVARPPCPEEKKHKVRMVCGVGMRPQIWKEFVNRFNVKNFYSIHLKKDTNSKNIFPKGTTCG